MFFPASSTSVGETALALPEDWAGLWLAGASASGGEAIKRGAKTAQMTKKCSDGVSFILGARAIISYTWQLICLSGKCICASRSAAAKSVAAQILLERRQTN